MKKLILTAFCLGLMLTSATLFAGSTQPQSEFVFAVENDDRQPVKAEDLPDGIRKSLTAEAYKGWKVIEAALVTTNNAADANNNQEGSTSPAGDVKADGTVAADAAQQSYYEVTITNDKETKTLKFQKDGTLLN
jgi:hypothetical protein